MFSVGNTVKAFYLKNAKWRFNITISTCKSFLAEPGLTGNNPPSHGTKIFLRVRYGSFVGIKGKWDMDFLSTLLRKTQLLIRFHLTYLSFQIYFRWLAIYSLTQPPSIGLGSDDASTRSKSRLKQFEKLYIPEEGVIIPSSLRIIQHGRIRLPCASKICISLHVCCRCIHPHSSAQQTNSNVSKLPVFVSVGACNRLYPPGPCLHQNG